jgi:isopenicillin-N N-acyltransferase-like protein
MFKTLVFMAAAAASDAAYCSGSPDPGIRTNDFPIFEGEMKFVRKAENAILYSTGPENATFPIVHLYGTAYEMGFAQGTILKKEINQFISATWSYLINMALEEMGELLPPAMQAKLISMGMERLLDWCARVTEPFTPKAYFDEMHGLADASGVDYQMILRLNLFAEVTKASCSFFGAWGPATVGGKTFQLRALDYDTVGPFKDYHIIQVYHPTDGGHAFGMLGWPGSIGMMTGFSSEQMAISEIGVSFPDDSFGQGTENTPPEKVHGKPWMFITRDAMQFEKSIQSAEATIESSNRTCNLIIGVGDGKAGVVNGIEYSGYVAVPYNDSTLLPVNDTWHGQIEGVVYNGMDWLCPVFYFRV